MPSPDPHRGSLSDQQQRALAVLSGAAAGRQLAVRVTAALDGARLRAALERVVAEHDLLRLRIAAETALAAAALPPAWQDLDLGGAETAAAGLLDAVWREPFDLAAGPLVRACRVTLAPADQLLVLTLPAVATDARGLENLLELWGDAYAGGDTGDAYAGGDAAARGVPAAAAALPYGRFVAWQRALRVAADGAAGRRFWRDRQIAGAYPDRGRGEPCELAGELPPDLASRCAAVAAAHGLPAAALALAAWGLLLERLGGAVPRLGVASEGRGYEELEAALGPFARWLPLPWLAAPDLSFAALAGRVDEARREGEQWQEYFAWEDAGAAFSAGFEAPPPPRPLRFAGRPAAVHRRRGVLEPAAVTLRWPAAAPPVLVYDAAVLDEAAAAGLWRELVRLLDAATREPGTPAGSLAVAGSLPCLAPPAGSPAAPAGPAAPATPVEKILATVWCEVLGLPEVGIHDNFFVLGGDSIQNILMCSRARQLGLELAVREVVEQPTIAQLARRLAAPAADAAPAAQAAFAADDAAALPAGAADAADTGGDGEALLPPPARRFFEEAPAEPHHHNMAVALELLRPLAPRHLAAALTHLVRHHEALRWRYAAAGDAWQATVAAAAGAPPVTTIDLAGLPAGRLAAATAAAAAAVQASLDLARGPLLRLVLFVGGGERPPRLVFVVHHLAVDAVSWPLLLADLRRACLQAEAGAPIHLEPAGSGVRQWVSALRRHAATPAVTAELPHWRAAAARAPAPLPVDFAAGPNLRGAVRSVVAEIDAETTATLVRELPAAHDVRVVEALLAALLQAVADWTGARSLLVEMEGHGREELPGLDLARTVGWFTSQYPVWLDLERGATPSETVAAVRRQLRAVPGRGQGYGLLRYLHDEAGAVLRPAAPEISFNYVGRLDQLVAASDLWRPAAGGAGPERSPRNRRRLLFELNAGIVGTRLAVAWLYCERLHRRATVEALAGRFRRALGEIAAAHRAGPAGARLDGDELAAVLAQVGGKGAPR